MVDQEPNDREKWRLCGGKATTVVETSAYIYTFKSFIITHDLMLELSTILPHNFLLN